MRPIATRTAHRQPSWRSASRLPVSAAGAWHTWPAEVSAAGRPSGSPHSCVSHCCRVGTYERPYTPSKTNDRAMVTAGYSDVSPVRRRARQRRGPRTVVTAETRQTPRGATDVVAQPVRAVRVRVRVRVRARATRRQRRSHCRCSSRACRASRPLRSMRARQLVFDQFR